MSKEIKIFSTQNWQEYELLDTGEGEKLERFGDYVFARPCEDAFWGKSLPAQTWQKADGKFFTSKEKGKSGWDIKKDVPKKWEMSYKGIKFLASPTPFRHLGFFPEQATQWEFIEKTIKNSKRKIKFLNLFGYTGVVSLFALRAGAEVTHVDASGQVLDWAKANEKLNLDIGCPSGMRVIEDDALKFIEREIKRGNKYDAVIMDPPKFGRGPKGEIWKLEEKMPRLMSAISGILSNDPLFVILTSYATNSSALSLGTALEFALKQYAGTVEQGELCLPEKSSGKIVSLATTAIWQKK